MSQLYLYVTSVPEGEAPLWVREKWVGLKLPLTGPLSVGTFRGSGVLSGPQSLAAFCVALFRKGLPPKREGYIVNALDAVKILEVTHPEAAAWWRANVSHLMRPSRRFLFQREVGHVGK
jgi:hypothetical protein